MVWAPPPAALKYPTRGMPCFRYIANYPKH
jgi:hypothetical protein